jgi:hypothetical protein
MLTAHAPETSLLIFGSRHSTVASIQKVLVRIVLRLLALPPSCCSALTPDLLYTLLKNRLQNFQQKIISRKKIMKCYAFQAQCDHLLLFEKLTVHGDFKRNISYWQGLQFGHFWKNLAAPHRQLYIEWLGRRERIKETLTRKKRVK